MSGLQFEVRIFYPQQMSKRKKILILSVTLCGFCVACVRVCVRKREKERKDDCVFCNSPLHANTFPNVPCLLSLDSYHHFSITLIYCNALYHSALIIFLLRPQRSVMMRPLERKSRQKMKRMMKMMIMIWKRRMMKRRSNVKKKKTKSQWKNQSSKRSVKSSQHLRSLESLNI